MLRLRADNRLLRKQRIRIGTDTGTIPLEAAWKGEGNPVPLLVVVAAEGHFSREHAFSAYSSAL